MVTRARSRASLIAAAGLSLLAIMACAPALAATSHASSSSRTPLHTLTGAFPLGHKLCCSSQTATTSSPTSTTATATATTAQQSVAPTTAHHAAKPGSGSGSRGLLTVLAALAAAALSGWAIWPVVRRRSGGVGGGDVGPPDTPQPWRAKPVARPAYSPSERYGAYAQPRHHGDPPYDPRDDHPSPEGYVHEGDAGGEGVGGEAGAVDAEVRPGRWTPRRQLGGALTVNAVSLLSATILTSGVGLVFWAVAARLRSPAVVGHASAAVAALILLASISQLNLTAVFMRLLPAAGRLGRRLVGRGYLVVLIMAVVVGGVYVLSGLGSRVVADDWESRALFVLAVPVLAIFALQDSVLTALRLTPWVPVENLAFAIAKLALLPALAWLSVGGGIVIAWVLPAALAVSIVTRLLFGRAIPKLDTRDGTLPDRRRLVSFVAGEYVTSIFAIVTVQVLPLIIVWRLGAASAAYFTIPWLIASGITLMLWNVGSSYVVEVASGKDDPRALLRRSVMMWAALAFAALIVCVVAAKPLLSVAGNGYAQHGAGLLRLIGLTTPFGAITAVFCTKVWLEQRVWTLAAFQAVSGVLLLCASLVLLPHLGLIAIGWANLGTQAVMAAVLVLMAGWRRLRRGVLVEAW